MTQDTRGEGKRGFAVERSPERSAEARQTLVAVLGRLTRMTTADYDEVVRGTLADVARLVGGDRAIIRMLSADGKRFEISHRWDSIPIATVEENDVNRYRALLADYASGETLTFSSLDGIPERYAAVGARLLSVGCRSACGVPIVDGERLLGRAAILCTDEREWPDEVRTTLRIYGEMLGTAISRVRATAALDQHLRVEQAIATLSSHLINVNPSRLDAELTEGLQMIAGALKMDRAHVGQLDDARERFKITHAWARPGLENYRSLSTGLSIAAFGWPLTEVMNDRIVVSHRDNLPPDAVQAAEAMDRGNARAMVHIPLNIDGEMIGVVSFQSSSGDAHIPDDMLARLRVVADVFSAALARHRAAESLSESESRFAQVIETALDGVVLLDTSGVILEWTPQSERLFGRQRPEVVGRRFVDVALDPEDVSRFQLDERAASAGRMELTGLRRDGHSFSLELSCSPMKRAGATIFALFVRDISDRKRAEQERQRAFDEIARLKARVERERDYLREEVGSDLEQTRIVGQSAAIRRALESLEAVASTTAAVLIHGESGVGKELFARDVHARSRRASSPLVKVNCASIPESLFESEFFGHVRGSFTGAHKDRVGRFELADGGTLFLDEVGEIPLDMQAKLLRVLQEGEFERVGDDRTRRVDVRIVAATNRNLAAEVQTGNFRRDLYYRLSVFPIEVPPLRDRPEDIVALAQSFLRKIARSAGRVGLELSEAQQAALLDYDWPGNIRELEHVIERAVILSPEPPLQLSRALSVTSGGPSSVQSTLRGKSSEGTVLTDQDLRKLERDNLVSALEKANGRISGEGGAAELLKMNPSTLRDRLKALGITRRA